MRQQLCQLVIPTSPPMLQSALEYGGIQASLPSTLLLKTLTRPGELSLLLAVLERFRVI